MDSKAQNIDEYIADFPEETQKILKEIRNLIKKIAPEAEESISYMMPTFKLHGVLVYFAAYKNHIGFYALPSGNEAFKEDLKKYKTGKGSIQFPLNQPIPYDLISQIVQIRVAENLTKFKTKKSK